jgi:septum formation protein
MASVLDTPPALGGVLLASQSPRRRRLLSWLGLPFDVAVVDTAEDLDSPLASDPEALASYLAAEKALAARAEGLARDTLVLAFDTIVVHAGQLLGKPADVADAWRMLRSLSGRTHHVVTGGAVLSGADAQPASFAVTTEVAMKQLTDCQIEAWMAMGEFMGCAGAYNIEGQVAEVSDAECFQNVAGLPLCHLYRFLASDPELCAAHGTPDSPVTRCDAALSRRCTLGPMITGRADRG